MRAQQTGLRLGGDCARSGIWRAKDGNRGCARFWAKAILQPDDAERLQTQLQSVHLESGRGQRETDCHDSLKRKDLEGRSSCGDCSHFPSNHNMRTCIPGQTLGPNCEDKVLGRLGRVCDRLKQEGAV